MEYQIDLIVDHKTQECIWLIGAPLQKQVEWEEKPQQDKIKTRIIKPDTDRDNVPDEYDCQPDNPDKQDFGQRDIAHLPETEQLKLVERGEKPTFVTANKQNTNLPFIVSSPSWIQTNDETGEVEEYGPPNLIYYNPTNTQEAKNIDRLIKAGNLNTKEYHYNMGKNLGYSEVETLNFIKSRGIK